MIDESWGVNKTGVDGSRTHRSLLVQPATDFEDRGIHRDTATPWYDVG
jgi:hypothetical protein